MRLILVLFVALIINGKAQAEVQVSDRLRFELDSGYQVVRAGTHWYRVFNVPQGGKLSISIALANKVYKDVSVLLCGEREFQLFQQGRSARCYGQNRAKGPYKLETGPLKQGRYFLVLDNGYSMVIKKKVSYSVVVDTPMPKDLGTRFDKLLKGMSKDVYSMFKIKELDMEIRPCGEENAYSWKGSGKITFCTELAMKLIKDNNKGALAGILMHELGHSLLDVLGMPNHDNEQTVDEFAIVMLYYNNQQELAFGMIDWLETHNSAAQAQFKLYNDDRHPISVQRIRNIRNILSNPRPVIERWNRFLYPHMRPEGLMKQVRENPYYADKELANQFLAAN